MPEPFTIVQLTDPHIGAPWSEDPVSALGAAVAAVDERLGVAPDAVIVAVHALTDGRLVSHVQPIARPIRG